MNVVTRPSRLMVLAMLVASGCTGDDDAAPVTTFPAATTMPTTTAVPIPDVTVATRLFSGLATRDPAATESALQYVVPGSTAAHFVAHQAAVLRLIGPTESVTADTSDAGFSLCDAADNCVEYSDIDAVPSTGMVAGFSIDAVPLAGRVVADGSTSTFEGGDVRVVSAYRSNAAQLTVIVSINNTSTVDLAPFAFAATYQATTSSSSVETTAAWGAEVIAPGTNDEFLFVLPDQSFGGLIRLSALREDGIDLLLEATVPPS